MSQYTSDYEQAMYLLLQHVEDFCWENAEHNYTPDFDNQSTGDSELRPMDGLMCELIRLQYWACEVSNVDWEPMELIKQMGNINWMGGTYLMRPRDHHEMDELELSGTFDSSRYLLQLACQRQTVTMLADRLTGHILPPELVEMVRDYICDEEELLADE